MSEVEYRGRSNFLQSKLDQLVKQDERTSSKNEPTSNYFPYIFIGTTITLLVISVSLFNKKKKKKQN